MSYRNSSGAACRRGFLSLLPLLIAVTTAQGELDETGRSSARAMGEALRRLQIPIGQVLSSPAYRALETIKFAQLGPATTYAQLGDSGQSMVADKSGARAAWLKAKTAQPVTHFPNINEIYPQEAAGLGDGRGGVQIVTRVKIDEWPHLDAVP
jgi:hypothetical protein